MTEITREELLKNGYKDVAKWKVRKGTFALFKEWFLRNRTITIGLTLFAAFCIINAILIYNFYRMLILL